jgi:chromosome segregation ATPase
MASRAVAVAGSRSGAAAESSSMMASRKTTKTTTYKTDASGNVSTEVHTHVDNASDASSSSMRRMEERIRVIMEDLEAEQGLRKRIEREKQTLQVQIIALSERLTEAEGGAENQLDINRKREAEMAKLRKLLEDVHMESEQNIHLLKKKHQEAMMELQEHISVMSTSKEKITKEKSKMSTEISELLAHIEVLNQEKCTMKKCCEKLEITINEYNVKIQEMSKSIIEMTSHKTRLAQDNQDSTRKLNEFKLAIETAGLDKNKVTGQLKDLQSNLDNLTRAKNTAESKVKTLEQHIKTLTIECEEHREIRLDLERTLVKMKEESGDWKKKYDMECKLHIDDVETLKKKFMVQITQLTDQYESTLMKLKAADAQKQKLSQEIQVIVKEFESSQTVIKELTLRIAVGDKKVDELAVKLREMTNLYERADKENKARAQEVVRLGNEMDRCKMANETLSRDKTKAEDDVRSMKMELDALKNRFHEIDVENRKLAHDREELARAFKDTDAGKIKAEARVRELEDELKKLRADADHRLNSKDGEAMQMRKKLTMEIESLTVRLQETESRLRNEVEKIKKKMSVTIAELEMSLDASNKANVQLQNSSKVQVTKIMELTSIIDKTNLKFNDAVGQLDGTSKRLAISDGELGNLKKSLTQILNEKKMFESKLTELSVKITDITNININLTSVKTKLEKDLSLVSTNYDDMARELKLADDRANKAANDAQHFEGLLREESVKVQKIDNVKKALESEVKSLTIRMEEIETTAISSSKRTIQKMEMRIVELEEFLSKEKGMHVETTTVLHKKERSVKELLLQSEEDRKNILILQESLERLNEKIKMYKRQLEEQEAISNSNIMRVKKFQRELESAEGRANEAESSLNSFRSQQRVFAAAAESRRDVNCDPCQDVIIRKNIVNVAQSSANTQESRIVSTSQTQNASSSSAMESSSAVQASSSRAGYRAGSTYSRAGSMARTSMARQSSIGRASSMLRY